MSGRGGSGKYGDGPAHHVIVEQLKALHNQISDAEGQRNAELRAFDVATPEVLETKYGVRLEQNETTTRKRMLHSLMRQDDTYAVYLRVIQSILLIMLFVLLIAKLAEPNSIRMYYSAALQDYHEQYRSGSFDYLLPANEQYRARGGMTPFRF